MVETQEDVGTFDANISPSCTAVMKQVENRCSELTNVSHAAILGDEINQVSVKLLWPGNDWDTCIVYIYM